jgi:hypothetical protein
MKRFFCTICKRVKRVRRLPITIVNAENPVERTGKCDYHVTGRVQPVKSAKVVKKVTVEVPAQKSRRRA